MIKDSDVLFRAIQTHKRDFPDTPWHTVLTPYRNDSLRIARHELESEIAAKAEGAERDKNATPVDDDEEARRGALLAEVLGLKRDKQNRAHWWTSWGSKTDLGLFKTVKRIIEEGK